MQVDIKVLKQLDRNLYAGEEVREVYKEIMKTVKSNHLDPSLVLFLPLPFFSFAFCSPRSTFHLFMIII